MSYRVIIRIVNGCYCHQSKSYCAHMLNEETEDSTVT